jgi:hypothetical protein
LPIGATSIRLGMEEQPLNRAMSAGDIDMGPISSFA